MLVPRYQKQCFAALWRGWEGRKMESARAWVGRAAERAWRAPGMSSVGGRIGGGGVGWAPEGRVVLLSVSLLGNCAVSLQMRRSTDASAALNRLLTRVRCHKWSDVQICGFSSLAVAAERRAGGRWPTKNGWPQPNWDRFCRSPLSSPCPNYCGHERTSSPMRQRPLLCGQQINMWWECCIYFNISPFQTAHVEAQPVFEGLKWIKII